MKVVVIQPDHSPMIPDMVFPEEIEGDLSSMQKLVGGYIEVVNLPNSEYIIVCDDEGLLKNSPKNVLDLSGTCFICKSEGAEMIGLTDFDVEIVIEILKGFADTHFEGR